MSSTNLTHDGHVLIIEFAEPETRNTLSVDLMGEIADAFTAAANDDNVRVVITTGAGSTYSAGGDLQRMSGTGAAKHSTWTGYGRYGMPPLTPQAKLLDQLGPGRWVEVLTRLDKPTIAALNGSAAGGGLCLALLHDFRIAVPEAKFATAFMRIGVTPEMGMSYLLPRLIGWRAATDLLLGGRTVDAEEAATLGMVDELAPSGAALTSALTLAHELAALPPLALRQTKSLLRRAQHTTFEQHLLEENQVQQRLFATEDHKEGVHAFLERRPPVFRGR
jgi:enoyl-CoA hydratase/carnithine racemase